MDEASQRGFDEMAQCVVDEYARFEPLPGMHIDGIMTQGENIADNGGALLPPRHRLPFCIVSFVV